MDVSIIILNYKTAGLVKHCIKNAMASLVHQPLTYEIIVVDNGSYDGCLEFVSKNHPEIICVQTGKNKGFAAGNNAGMRAARGDYMLILTPDVTVLDNAIGNLVAFMRAHPHVGLAGPRLNNPDGSFQISCRTFQTPKLILLRRTPLVLIPSLRKALDEHLMLNFDHRHTRPVDWVTGACMIVSREAYEHVGGFDERFFFYVEDMDWCRRFWIAGFPVYYVAEAQMVHLWEQASGTHLWGFLKINKMARWHIAAWIRYFIKYFRNSNYGSAPSTITR